MSTYNVWYAVDQDVFDAVVHGKIDDALIDRFVVLAASLSADEREDNYLDEDDGDDRDDRTILAAFFRHRSDGTWPETGEYRMTRLVALAVERFGTRCADFTEGSPGLLEEFSERVYSKTPGLDPLARLYGTGGIGYSIDWPCMMALTADEVKGIAAALRNLDEEMASVLDEEREMLLDAVNAAVADGRNVITVAG